MSNEPKKRVRRASRAAEPGAEQAPDGAVDGALDTNFTQAELREFLAADYLDTQADPVFKETLRKKLWAFVSNRDGRGPTSS